MKQITKVLLLAILVCSTALVADAVVYKTNHVALIDANYDMDDSDNVKGQVSINVSAAGKGTIVFSKTGKGKRGCD